MKLTEKQAFSLMYTIEHYFGDDFKITPENRADFVMTELINSEVCEDE